ncbi:MAG TPA: hypothetical protein VH142_14645, partial [Polyangiaceae bacterium]|nr:hypothetical protein [Polyangiaceae bacterium]
SDTASDAPPSDGTTGTDGATDAGDSGTITIACSAPVRVDTLAGVTGTENPSLEAAAFGAKYVATWVQLAAVSGDAQSHVKARAWNGSSFNAEIDLGTTLGDVRFADDGAGLAFEQWTASSTMRAVFDFSALSFSTATAFGNIGTSSDTDVAGAGPGSALSAYVLSNGTFAADRWADGGWTSTGLAASALPTEPRLVSNGARAVLGWYNPTATFHAAAYDGGGWGAAVQTLQSDAGAIVSEQYVVLSNGDALYMFSHPSSVEAVRFDATAGTFDAPVVVEAQPNVVNASAARRVMAVDSADRVTIGWTRMVASASHAFVSRSFDKGVTWSTPTDLGLAESLVMAVDPSTSAVVVATRNLAAGTGILLQGATATGTTWTTPVPAQLEKDPTGNYQPLDQLARVVFTTAGVVVVALQRDADAGVAYTVQSVTCTL